MENPDTFFSIDKVVVAARREAPSGCELCQHCFLLRRTFLEKKRQEELEKHNINEKGQQFSGREAIHKEA